MEQQIETQRDLSLLVRHKSSFWKTILRGLGERTEANAVMHDKVTLNILGLNSGLL